MKSLSRPMAVIVVVLLAGAAVVLATLFDGRWGWPALALAAILFLLSMGVAIWNHQR